MVTIAIILLSLAICWYKMGAFDKLAVMSFVLAASSIFLPGQQMVESFTFGLVFFLLSLRPLLTVGSQVRLSVSLPSLFDKVQVTEPVKSISPPEQVTAPENQATVGSVEVSPPKPSLPPPTTTPFRSSAIKWIEEEEDLPEPITFKSSGGKHSRLRHHFTFKSAIKKDLDTTSSKQRLSSRPHPVKTSPVTTPSRLSPVTLAADDDKFRAESSNSKQDTHFTAPVLELSTLEKDSLEHEVCSREHSSSLEEAPLISGAFPSSPVVERANAVHDGEAGIKSTESSIAEEALFISGALSPPSKGMAIAVHEGEGGNEDVAGRSTSEADLLISGTLPSQSPEMVSVVHEGEGDMMEDAITSPLDISHALEPEQLVSSPDLSAQVTTPLIGVLVEEAPGAISPEVASVETPEVNKARSVHFDSRVAVIKAAEEEFPSFERSLDYELQPVTVTTVEQAPAAFTEELVSEDYSMPDVEDEHFESLFEDLEDPSLPWDDIMQNLNDTCTHLLPPPSTEPYWADMQTDFSQVIQQVPFQFTEPELTYGAPVGLFAPPEATHAAAFADNVPQRHLTIEDALWIAAAPSSSISYGNGAGQQESSEFTPMDTSEDMTEPLTPNLSHANPSFNNGMVSAIAAPPPVQYQHEVEVPQTDVVSGPTMDYEILAVPHPAGDIEPALASAGVAAEEVISEDDLKSARENLRIMEEELEEEMFLGEMNDRQIAAVEKVVPYYRQNPIPDDLARTFSKVRRLLELQARGNQAVLDRRYTAQAMDQQQNQQQQQLQDDAPLFDCRWKLLGETGMTTQMTSLLAMVTEFEYITAFRKLVNFDWQEDPIVQTQRERFLGSVGQKWGIASPEWDANVLKQIDGMCKYLAKAMDYPSFWPVRHADYKSKSLAARVLDLELKGFLGAIFCLLLRLDGPPKDAIFFQQRVVEGKAQKVIWDDKRLSTLADLFRQCRSVIDAAVIGSAGGEETQALAALQFRFMELQVNRPQLYQHIFPSEVKTVKRRASDADQAVPAAGKRRRD